MSARGVDCNVEALFNNLLKDKMNLNGFLNRNQHLFFGVHFDGAVPEFLLDLCWRNYQREATTNALIQHTRDF